jgi:hypothetical protein
MMDEAKSKMYEIVYKFMVDNRVSCEDSIYQTDRCIENAYELMGSLYKAIEPFLPVEEER